jgi:hypothetical protein
MDIQPDQAFAISLLFWSALGRVQSYNVLRAVFRFAPAVAIEVMENVQQVLAGFLKPSSQQSKQMFESVGTDICLFCLKLLRECGNRALNTSIFPSFFARRENPLFFAICLVLAGNMSALPDANFSDPLQFSVREWAILAIFCESNTLSPIITTALLSSFDSIPSEFSKYAFYIVGNSKLFTETLARALQTTFRSNVAKFGARASRFDLNPNYYKFMPLYRDLLDSPQSPFYPVILNVILDVTHVPGEPYTAGILALMRDLSVDDVRVRYRAHGRTLWRDGWLIQCDSQMLLIDVDFCEVSEFVATEYVVEKNGRDTSLLVADHQLFAILIDQFQAAIKSRESISHYLAVRAVVESLRLTEFCEFAKDKIPIEQIIPLIDSFHIATSAEHD